MQATNTAMNKAVIAAQRFALGARPGELTAIGAQAEQWLLEQISSTPSVSFDTTLASSIQILQAHADYRMAKKAYKEQAEQQKSMLTENSMVMENTMAAENKQSPTNNNQSAPKSPTGKIYKQLCLDALQQSINSSNSFNWRCLDFFSNHFSVTAQGSLMRGLAPTLEREAIAPNLFGQFEDLLIAVTQHPAMLIYLNNQNSIGPSTKYAKKNRGLNENLAREILELHTLGVNGGYTQQDVTELAKAITGWSVSRPSKDKQEGFIYRYQRHEPGERVLLGKTYAEQGLGQGKEMLKDLAKHPNTARFICTKIVRHFISDETNPTLVEQLTAVWIESKGDLKQVFSALIKHPLAWQAEQQKLKTPREFVIASYRTLADKKLPINFAFNALNQLGQGPFKAGSPAGYSDMQEDWDGASALMNKINWVSKLSTRKNLRTINIQETIQNSFANTLSTHSYQMVTRAESRQQALTLLLLSPEFLRR